jgi:hypothetical protein
MGVPGNKNLALMKGGLGGIDLRKPISVEKFYSNKTEIDVI